ncbi:hypothetical protein EKE94_05340 [Mesobaculum littorinae]|uniref:Uncharacterized protein n=1 Tax=Mesobaculum littorinae TaxID=2486419 RepID=A0A438AI17_9RHOB|nr:hypothetical protein [Mesobaculum littorinae]RVV98350.1 hypothetical protein EKE94_05340 [Mesobaculum littorinae]
MTSPAPEDGWEGILDPGEEILWQGRPDGALVLSGGLGRSVFGLAFTAVSVLILREIAADGPPLAMLWALPFLGIGLYMLAGRFAWDALRRRHTWYTLTDRRAFIATELFGRRRLNSWPIRPDTPVTLDPGPPDDVWFAEDWREIRHHDRRDRGHRHSRPRRVRRRVGFRRIAEGRRVMGLIHQIQSTASGTATA